MVARRARHGKALLAAGAGALTVSMTGCPFTAANLIAFPPQPLPACTATDDPTLWLTGTFDGTNLILQLQQFSVTGVELANLFTGVDCTLGAPQFDSTSLASSTSVSMTVAPNTTGAPTATVRTGLTCNGAARQFDVRIDLVSLAVSVVDAAP